MPDRFSVALAALGHSLALAEAVIHGLKLGVGGEVPLRPDETSPVLAYGYIASDEKRTLYLRSGDTVETIASLSIKARRDVASAIPRLVDALRANRAGAATQIQASADQLETYLDTLDNEGTD